MQLLLQVWRGRNPTLEVTRWVDLDLDLDLESESSTLIIYQKASRQILSKSCCIALASFKFRQKFSLCIVLQCVSDIKNIMVIHGQCLDSHMISRPLGEDFEYDD